jgi:hypothetical protein
MSLQTPDASAEVVAAYNPKATGTALMTVLQDMDAAKQKKAKRKAAATPELRLQIELVSRGLWGDNLRRRLGENEWRRVRNSVAPANKLNGCEICGAHSKETLHGHEVWEYQENGDRGVARLKGIGMYAMIATQSFTLDALLIFSSAAGCRSKSSTG